jgi:hypothetical protein
MQYVELNQDFWYNTVLICVLNLNSHIFISVFYTLFNPALQKQNTHVSPYTIHIDYHFLNILYVLHLLSVKV